MLAEQMDRLPTHQISQMTGSRKSGGSHWGIGLNFAYRVVLDGFVAWKTMGHQWYAHLLPSIYKGGIQQFATGDGRIGTRLPALGHQRRGMLFGYSFLSYTLLFFYLTNALRAHMFLPTGGKSRSAYPCAPKTITRRPLNGCGFPINV